MSLGKLNKPDGQIHLNYNMKTKQAMKWNIVLVVADPIVLFNFWFLF